MTEYRDNSPSWAFCRAVARSLVRRLDTRMVLVRLNGSSMESRRMTEEALADVVYFTVRDYNKSLSDEEYFERRCWIGVAEEFDSAEVEDEAGRIVADLDHRGEVSSESAYMRIPEVYYRPYHISPDCSVVDYLARCDTPEEAWELVRFHKHIQRDPESGERWGVVTDTEGCGSWDDEEEVSE